MSRVLVTGASGFIATHVVQQLQQQGYAVRGTVRSLNNAAKVKPLLEICPNAEHKLELVEADLLKVDGWAEAMKDCTYVLHLASPFPKENPAHEDEVIKPAVDGTLNVLRAAKEAGTVKRVVVTSSVAAISNGTEGLAGHDDTVPYDESDWTDTATATTPYYKSKTLAEKAAWDFVRDLPDDEKFELAVVNPAYVLGPILCGSDFTSLELPKRLMERQMPLLPKMNMLIVDVRDVAAAHLAAMMVPEAAGNRHFLSAGNMWVRDMALIMSEEFKSQGYSIPTHNAPNVVVKINGLFDKSIKMILPSLGKVLLANNDRMKNVLNVNPRDMKETVLDMCYSMVERGFVKRTRKYRGRQEDSK